MPTDQSSDAAINDQSMLDSGSPADPRRTAFGSFMIETTEFALPVEVVREVVEFPEIASQIPLSPDYFAGLFILRGQAIPMVDLRAIFELGPSENTQFRKVAIMESGGVCIGLIFDSTGEVIQNQRDAQIDFSRRHDGVKDTVIEGVLKLDGGHRVVQVLDPFKILGLERIPRTKTHTEKTENNSWEKRLAAVTFEVSHCVCAFDSRYVQEVMELPKIEQSFLSHGLVLGTFNLRNVTVPVVDFRAYLNQEKFRSSEAGFSASNRLLILNLPTGLVGVLVYSINNIVSYFESDVLPFSKLGMPQEDKLQGCISRENGEMIMLFDHDRIMNDPVLVDAARSCREIHPPEEQEEQASFETKTAARRSFITFSVENEYALDIACVSEVINRPGQLLAPPSALKFVEGIANLRGELVTLINPWRLYGLPEPENIDQKVVIIVHEGVKYGMLVESVDQIIMVTDREVLPLPPLANGNESRKVAQDVSASIHLTAGIDAEDAMMIIDTSSLVSRCLSTAA